MLAVVRLMGRRWWSRLVGLQVRGGVVVRCDGVIVGLAVGV